MKKDWIIGVIALILVLALTHFTAAETIVLKSGKEVVGEITERTDEHIKLDISGVSVPFFLDEIESVDGEAIAQPEVKQKVAVQGNTVESSSEGEQFKQITLPIAKEFAATVSPPGPEYAASDAEIEETFARQRILNQEWIEKLKAFVKNNPQSIWADDAQYIITVLSFDNPPQEALELEYLLREYPNMHIEDWTRNTHVYMMPGDDIPVEVVTRITLAFNYAHSGSTDKFRQICEESANKYPDRAGAFEALLQGENPAVPK